MDTLQSDALNLSQLMMGAAWTLIVLMIGLWAVITIVKRLGWTSETQLEPKFGIALPLVLGVASLMYVMTAASR